MKISQFVTTNKVCCFCLLFALISGVKLSAEELPDYDIVVFDLINSNGVFEVRNPQLIASSPEYDNQPSFSSDGKTLYFTHIEKGNADVWKWSSESRLISKVTDTPESEFSPTEIPFESNSLSHIRVEADGTQRLWKLDNEQNFSVIFADIKPVGYHVWSGKNIAMFVLGEPHSLQTTKVNSQKVKTIDWNIGRCLQKVPERNEVSYSIEKDGQHWLKLFSFDSGLVTEIKKLPASSQDYVWYSTSQIISSETNQLVMTTVKPESAWLPIRNSTGLKLNNITRLAISKNTEKLAVVFQKNQSTPFL